MSNTTNNPNFLRKHLLTLIIVTIFTTSLIIPGLIPNNLQVDPEIQPYTPPQSSIIFPTPVSALTVAGEPNFTRTDWPFIMDNVPDFSWKNPGRFNASHSNTVDGTGRGVVRHPRVGSYIGYDTHMPAPGIGTQKYPKIYQALNGLNESNIRIMYLDANYQWVSVPFQIDQRGWANVWTVGDLNKWGGLQAVGTSMQSTFYDNGGGHHAAADSTTGLGWIGGDLVTSKDHAGTAFPGANYAGNDLLWDWYRVPTWTFISKINPNTGGYNSEEVQIDAEYRNNLIWCFLANASRPHMAWLEGDSGGAAPGGHGNPFNRNNGDGSGVVNAWADQDGATGERGSTSPQDDSMAFWRYSLDGYAPCFVNTTAAVGSCANPWVDAYGHNNMVFMGDTWFTTPGNYATTAGGGAMPQWVKNAFPYQQIAGALDLDDELVFNVYAGRQAPNYYWWNYTYFPYRFELAITDPVDGGRTWMYICFNNQTAYNPIVNPSAVNLGAPQFTTPIKDYVSWDPQTTTVTSTYYQMSFNERNPTVLDSLRLFGTTDGQALLTQMQKMYIFGRIDQTLLAPDGQSNIPAAFKIAREGVWYSGTGAATSYSELICTLDNPSVNYPSLVNDTSKVVVYSTYGGVTQYTADRAISTLTAPSGCYGLQGVAVSPTRRPLKAWEPYGDGRAIIDGPVRIVFYQQQFATTGLYVHLYVTDSTSGFVIDDDVDLVLPLLDGPAYYYSRMQIGTDFEVQIPGLEGFIIDIYYLYFMCGSFNLPIRGDFNISVYQEWSGAPDGVDQKQPNGDPPIFGFTDGKGWTKIGGTNPKTSGYAALGYNIPDGVAGSDYYVAGGNPLLEQDPVTNPAVCPGDGSNMAGFPDWALVTSQTHGGVWLYIPRREAMELKDNYYDPVLGRSPGSPAQFKLWWRDDAYQSEFGVCADGQGTSGTWVRGGAGTSKFHYMMVYDDFKPGMASQTAGHKLYLQYYFPVEGICTFTGDQGPGNHFVYGQVTPDALIYRKGDTIQIHVAGSHPTGTITADFSAIDAGQTRVMTNNGDGTWDVSYTISSSTHSTPYPKNITLTAEVFLLDDTVYQLTVSIDDVAPTGAALAALPTSTSEPQVVLSWVANPGSDAGCASIENPSGIGHYRLWRGTSSTNVNTILADNLPNSQRQFIDTFLVNGQIYYYKIETFDTVGNSANSTTRSTTVTLPFTPAQPNNLAATTTAASGITLDWTANPGYVAGGAIDGYRVFMSNNTNQQQASLGPWKTLTTTELPSTTKTYTKTFTAYELARDTNQYFYFKVQSRDSASYVNSSTVMTRIDIVAPAPAELATPLPTYQSQGEEIIISWAIDLLPQYQNGGFPGQDLNGIDHWVIKKRIASGAWFILATVPYSADPEGQRVLDINVVDGTQYSYSIITYDSAGSWAKCLYNKTTTLDVVGPGVANIYSLTVGSTEVLQGATGVPVTVLIRNPGITAVTLNEVKLKFSLGGVDKTSDYTGTTITGLTQGLAALGGTWTAVFSIGVALTATLGTISITAETLYDNTKTKTGGLDSWTVTPDANLLIQTVTSSKAIVHPGEANIPVTVTVKNPGQTDAILETIQLTFMRDTVDLSSKFMATRTTPLPSTPFTGDVNIDFLVTASVTVTEGPVIVNAIVTGSAGSVALADTDGAGTPLNWGVMTYNKPVIVSVVADKAVYWSTADKNVITLTVTGDNAGHTVDANFEPLKAGAGWVAGTDNTDDTYTITYTLTTPHSAEGTYTVSVRATNASGSTTTTIAIRLGNAPQFSGWSQTPTNGNVEPTNTVSIAIDITDDGGVDTVSATLKYRVNGGLWNQRTMTYGGAGTGHWTTSIPAQLGGAVVEYYVNATDPLGYWATYVKSYSVNLPPPEPIWVPGSQDINDPTQPGATIDETNGAKLDTKINYSATVDTTYIQTGALYVIVLSAFDLNRDCFINVTTNVYLESPTATNVQLTVTYTSTLTAAGDMIRGRIYILTDLPSNGGKTLTWFNFVHTLKA